MTDEEFTVCPNCQGQLKKKKDNSDYDYDCLRCDRGWEVLENNDWLERFAGGRIYTIESVRRAQTWNDET